MDTPKDTKAIADARRIVNALAEGAARPRSIRRAVDKLVRLIETAQKAESRRLSNKE